MYASVKFSFKQSFKQNNLCTKPSESCHTRKNKRANQIKSTCEIEQEILAVLFPEFIG